MQGNSYLYKTEKGLWIKGEIDLNSRKILFYWQLRRVYRDGWVFLDLNDNEYLGRMPHGDAWVLDGELDIDDVYRWAKVFFVNKRYDLVYEALIVHILHLIELGYEDTIGGLIDAIKGSFEHINEGWRGLNWLVANEYQIKDGDSIKDTIYDSIIGNRVRFILDNGKFILKNEDGQDKACIEWICNHIVDMVTQDTLTQDDAKQLLFFSVPVA